MTQKEWERYVDGWLTKRRKARKEEKKKEKRTVGVDCPDCNLAGCRKCRGLGVVQVPIEEKTECTS